MAFTHPLYLWGLVALAVPIIIHLFNFKRFKKVYFTNVRLIRQLSEETRRQSKVRHLIILLMRMLAITALVLVFAGPYIPTERSDNSGGKRKLVSVYVDNSFSMEMRDADNILLESAKSMVPEIAESYTGEDVFRLLTNDLKAEHSHLMSASALTQYANAIELSPATLPLSALTDRFREIPEEAKDFAQDIYILSDLQRSTTDFQNLTIDSLSNVRIIILESENHDNIYPDSCWFESPVHIEGSTLSLKVRITNTSVKAIEKLPIRLFIDDQQEALTTISLPAEGTSTAGFSFVADKAGINNASIRIKDFPVTYDDSYYFTFEVFNKIDILVINKEKENPYLNALFGTDTTFNLLNVSEGQISPDLLARNDFIILNGVTNPGTGLAAEIRKQCESGKGVMIIPSDKPLQDCVLCKAFDISESTIKDTSKVRVSKILTQSPFFDQVFDIIKLKGNTLPENTDMPLVRQHFRGNYDMDTNEEVLMELANGTPFLIRKNMGGGWLYRFSSNLNEESGNFVTHALFVPVMYRMALLSKPVQHHNINIGNQKEIAFQTGTRNFEGAFIRNTKNDYSFIPGIEQRNGYTRFLFYDNIEEAGFYSVYQVDESASPKPEFVFAANYNRKESDLTTYNAEEAEENFKLHNIENVHILNAPPGKLQTALETLNHGRQLWHYFVYLCLLFLLAEVVLLRIWK